MFFRWFVVRFLRTLLIAKNTSWHPLWENFHTKFRYIRPLRKWLKVVYVWAIIGTRPAICSRKTFIPFVTFGLLVGGLKSSTYWVILLVRHYKRQEASKLANIKTASTSLTHTAAVTLLLHHTFPKATITSS